MDDILDDDFAKALNRWEICEKAERENRELSVKDRLFLAAEGGMWGDDDEEKRKDRPRFQIDRISPAKDQIVGNQLQEVIGPEISPGVGGNEETAEVYEGLIRRIENESDANDVYDHSFDETMTGGYGGWRILTRKDEDNPFEENQTPYIDQIESADTSLYFGPEGRKYDRSDAPDGFLVTYMVTETFKKKYPKATITDFSDTIYQSSTWFEGDKVRIAEYWKKVPCTIRYGKMSDGSILNLDEEQAALNELALRNIVVVEEKEGKSHKVVMRIMNGAEFLTEPQPWAGKYIPLIPQFGKQAVVDGKRFVWGLVRKARDPQEVYNYAVSSNVEAAAMVPKDPFWETPAMRAGHEADRKEFNTRNIPFQLYNADQAHPGPPSRSGAPSVQQALIQQMQSAKEDIYGTTGIHPPAMGNGPELKSGVAINRETEKGDRGSFIYQRNLRRSIQYTYTILIDLIPRIMDTERVEKIEFQDGTTEDAEINKVVIDTDTGEKVIINNLSAGKYIARAKAGASFMTKKAETVEQLKELATGSDVIQRLGMDIVVKNMELNEGDELHQRLRKEMINQGVVEPTDKEKEEMGLDQPPPPDPMQEELIKNLAAQTDESNMKVEAMMADIQKRDAETQKLIMDTNKSAMDAFATMTDALLKKVDAGIPLDDNDVDMSDGQSALVQESQVDVMENQEVAGSLPMNAKGQQPQGQIQPGAEIPSPVDMPVQNPTGPIGPQPGVDIPAGFNE